MREGDHITGATQQRGYRVRAPGGGRKLTEVRDPGILDALERIMANDVAGDPMGKQRWVRASTKQLSKKLREGGHQACPTTVSRLLKGMGFTMKGNRRRQIRVPCPERDQQFEYIAAQRERFTVAGLPVISVDSKKKELIGNFRSSGRAWSRQAEEVDEHDYPSRAVCKAVPYGVYDLTWNRGYVFVGTSNDTPEFAVDAVAHWWANDGASRYSGRDELLILADTGGSNGCRCRAWKYNLQVNLCDRMGLTATVCHYPSGCSKWNPVEHRLFSFISINWAGKPLRTLDMMLACIRGTTTETGLEVGAFLQERHYPKGQRVTQADMYGLNLLAHQQCPRWNYTIGPRR
ncbi:MAG: ISAzo13 family transposase [Deltaproteobacteria bacterium]|nr:ISAzo13 family transposase [Deltaproteobacteria bacterium]MBW2266632.1 ISAzo13 family transposase [Deltaproteobacteria bacterium]MBW2327074.1 ISAzo13 family transposase [Deltaproteobacteria bacterium]